MNRHTPGPWHVEPKQADHGGTLVIVNEDSSLIIAEIPPLNIEDEPDMDDAERSPEDEANARLIAAVPELLDALRDLVRRADTSELADGSSLDTAWATGLLIRIEGA